MLCEKIGREGKQGLQQVKSALAAYYHSVNNNFAQKVYQVKDTHHQELDKILHGCHDDANSHSRTVNKQSLHPRI